MKIDVFCAWGSSQKDVGINIYNEHFATYYDLTSEEAREIAAKLVAAADQADALQNEVDAHMENKE